MRHDPTRGSAGWPAALAIVLAVVLAAAPACGADGRGNGARDRRASSELDSPEPDSPFESYLEMFRDALTPAAAVLFENVRRDVAADAMPLPQRVRARLRPFFDGSRVDGVPLSPSILEQARFTVDAAGARRLFALTPTTVAAITIGDVVAFAPHEYQPDCIEGVALIAHELVHVAQYAALGRDRFLERYFLADALRHELGVAHADSDRILDPETNALEAAAYCHQREVCRALARDAALRACRGREVPVCPPCARRAQPR